MKKEKSTVRPVTITVEKGQVSTSTGNFSYAVEEFIIWVSTAEWYWEDSALVWLPKKGEMKAKTTEELFKYFQKHHYDK